MKGITGEMKVKNLPWVEIGTDISQLKNVDEILKKSKLDYEVLLRNPTVEGKRIDDFYAITKVISDGVSRSVNVFGFVKTRYIVPQNAESFWFFDKFVNSTKSSYEYAGSLDNGELVWVIAKLPDFVEINEMRISFYAMFSIYQTGKNGRRISIIPIRDVGNSILFAPSNSNPNFISLPNKTTLSSEDEILDDIVQMKDKFINATIESFQKMALQKISPRNEKEFFNKVVTSNNENSFSDLSGRFANKIASISDFYRNHPSQESIYGTLFGLYNSVAGYYHNVKVYTSPEKRFGTILIGGDSYRVTEESFRLAKKMLSPQLKP